jgi:hypothetical protein
VFAHGQVQTLDSIPSEMASLPRHDGLIEPVIVTEPRLPESRLTCLKNPKQLF